MTLEDNAKQIKRLAFMPVCRAPDTSHRRHPRVRFVQENLQAKPVMPGSRKQMVVDFEPGLFLKTAIGAAKVGKEIELRIRTGLQRRAHVDDVLGGYYGGYFAQRFNYFGDPIRICLVKREYQLRQA